jgi:hypothetical protein
MDHRQPTLESYKKRRFRDETAIGNDKILSILTILPSRCNVYYSLWQ